MIKDDNKLIWDALISERRNPDADTYDAEGELPGPVAELEEDDEYETLVKSLRKQGHGQTAAKVLARQRVKSMKRNTPGRGAASEEEEGPTSNLDNLIGLAAASEDAEGVEDINITDEDKAFEELDKHTPL